MKKMYQPPKTSWLDMDTELCQVVAFSITDQNGQPIDVQYGDGTTTTGDISGARSPRSVWSLDEE